MVGIALITGVNVILDLGQGEPAQARRRPGQGRPDHLRRRRCRAAPPTFDPAVLDKAQGRARRARRSSASTGDLAHGQRRAARGVAAVDRPAGDAPACSALKPAAGQPRPARPGPGWSSTTDAATRAGPARSAPRCRCSSPAGEPRTLTVVGIYADERRRRRLHRCRRRWRRTSRIPQPSHGVPPARPTAPRSPQVRQQVDGAARRQPRGHRWPTGPSSSTQQTGAARHRAAR